MSDNDRNYDPGPPMDHLLTMCIYMHILVIFLLTHTMFIMKKEPIPSNMKKYPVMSFSINFLNTYKYSNEIIMKYMPSLVKMLNIPCFANRIIRKSFKVKCITLTSVLNGKNQKSKNLKFIKSAIFKAINTSCKTIKNVTYLIKLCFRVLKNIFQIYSKCHPKLDNFSFISKTARKTCQLSKTRKCSNFSRTPQRSSIRMCRTHFRFKQKMLSDKCIFAFLKPIKNRMPKILLYKGAKNYSEECYQVIFSIFIRFLAEKWVFVSSLSKPNMGALTKVSHHDQDRQQNKPPWHNLN